MRGLTQGTDSTVIASGYGINIKVHGGKLLIEDGYGRSRRTRSFSRGSSSTDKIRRFVIVGSEGYITFEAMRWIADVESTMIHIDSAGRLINVGVIPGQSGANLRRSQALAASNDDGLRIAKWLVTRKIEAQHKVLAELGGLPASDYRDDVESAMSIDQLRTYEGQSARGYWRAWRDVPLTFADDVTEHWKTFGIRQSGKAGIRSSGKARGRSSAQCATTPGNALMNYMYALVEGSARVACMSVGLDSGIGIMHVDYGQRDSLVYDVMEPVRPIVDEWLFRVFSTHHFQVRGDFVESRNGVCRLAPTFAAWAALTADQWDKYTCAVAETVAVMLLGRKPPATFDKVLRTRLPVHYRCCRSCGSQIEQNGSYLCATCDTDRWCPSCGLSLKGRRSNVVYCSAACRREGV